MGGPGPTSAVGFGSAPMGGLVLHLLWILAFRPWVVLVPHALRALVVYSWVVLVPHLLRVLVLHPS